MSLSLFFVVVVVIGAVIAVVVDIDDVFIIVVRSVFHLRIENSRFQVFPTLKAFYLAGPVEP